MALGTIAIKRPVRLKNLNSFLIRLDYVHEKTNVDVHWTISDTSNHVVYVDLEITLTLTGDKNDLEAFATLI